MQYRLVTKYKMRQGSRQQNVVNGRQKGLEIAPVLVQFLCSAILVRLTHMDLSKASGQGDKAKKKYVWFMLLDLP